MSTDRYAGLAGRIEYVTDGVGVRGHEQFRLLRHADGGRTLRASCEMYDEQLLRDVYLNVDESYRPQCAHISLWLEQQFVGSGHYVFEPDAVSLHRTTAVGPEVTTTRLRSRAVTFASHAVQNDAWLYPAVDAARTADEWVTLDAVPVSSKLPNGADGPAVILSQQRHRFVSEETVSTAAGRFETHHYEFGFSDRPSIHYWVRPQDYLLVKCRWDFLKQSYVLTELETW